MTPEEIKQITDAVSAKMAAGQTPIAPPQLSLAPLANIAANAPAPIGVAVAINIPLPDGSEASAYLQLDPSSLQNLPQVVAGLVASGWPIRTFRPKAWGNGGWNQGGYNRWGRR